MPIPRFCCKYLLAALQERIYSRDFLLQHCDKVYVIAATLSQVCEKRYPMGERLLQICEKGFPIVKKMSQECKKVFLAADFMSQSSEKQLLIEERLLQSCKKQLQIVESVLHDCEKKYTNEKGCCKSAMCFRKVRFVVASLQEKISFVDDGAVRVRRKMRNKPRHLHNLESALRVMKDKKTLALTRQ